MFEHFVGAKTRPLRPWAIPLFFGAAGLVSAAVLAVVGYQLLALPLLEPPDTALAMAAAPPLPPAPPPGAKARAQKPERHARRKVAETVQPAPEKARLETGAPGDSATGADTAGSGMGPGPFNGLGIGDPLGDGIGIGDVPAPPPPPPPPRFVAPHAVSAQRINGDDRITPPDPVKLAIAREGKTLVVSVVKMCLTRGGAVSTLEVLRSSGFASYDAKILSAMRSWRYRPFRVAGKAVPVCTTVTFRYRQR